MARRHLGLAALGLATALACSPIPTPSWWILDLHPGQTDVPRDVTLQLRLASGTLTGPPERLARRIDLVDLTTGEDVPFEIVPDPGAEPIVDVVPDAPLEPDHDFELSVRTDPYLGPHTTSPSSAFPACVTFSTASAPRPLRAFRPEGPRTGLVHLVWSTEVPTSQASFVTVTSLNGVDAPRTEDDVATVAEAPWVWAVDTPTGVAALHVEAGLVDALGHALDEDVDLPVEVVSNAELDRWFARQDRQRVGSTPAVAGCP